MRNTSRELETENRLSKEVSARSQAQTELKALKKYHDEDTADLRDIEAEVIALAQNFEENGAYWQILDGEMSALRDENDSLRAQLEMMSDPESGGLATQMFEADMECTTSDAFRLQELSTTIKRLKEELASERKLRKESEQCLKQQAEDLRVELDRVSMTLSRAAAHEKVFAEAQDENAKLRASKHLAEESATKAEAQVQDLHCQLKDTSADRDKLRSALAEHDFNRQASRGTQRSSALSTALGSAGFSGTDAENNAARVAPPEKIESVEDMAASLSAMMGMYEERQAAMDDMQAKFEQLTKNAEFNTGRVVSMADTAKDMQASLTTTSTTCKAMNSFVGRIWNPRAPSRLRPSRTPKVGTTVRLSREPATPVRDPMPSRPERAPRTPRTPVNKY